MFTSSTQKTPKFRICKLYEVGLVMEEIVVFLNVLVSWASACIPFRLLSHWYHRKDKKNQLLIYENGVTMEGYQMSISKKGLYRNLKAISPQYLKKVSIESYLYFQRIPISCTLLYGSCQALICSFSYSSLSQLMCYLSLPLFYTWMMGTHLMEQRDYTRRHYYECLSKHQNVEGGWPPYWRSL